MKEYIARTGRVQSWLDAPEHRYPVSCTIHVPTDSMSGEDGLESSFTFTSHALRHGAGVAVHLSELRPSGSDNGKGLISAGPCPFMKVYSTLNEVLRRGGYHKAGAVVAHLDANHADLREFIEMPRHEIPWLKRCVNLTQSWWDDMEVDLRESLLDGIRKGDIWLAKVKHDQYGRRIRFNVCLEVAILSRGTCLLEHCNLSKCTPDELPEAFVAVMEDLVDLHAKTGVEDSGEYLDPKDDRQVGMGFIGLANLLAQEQITYASFGEALHDVINNRDVPSTPAWRLASKFQEAISAAANVARAADMLRAFAIAPTATCAYRYQDARGYTTTPEIAPPIARDVDRDSGTFGVTSYAYPPDCEIAEEVGWQAYWNVSTGICKMLERTGLFHGYSFNSWSDQIQYDEKLIQDWLDSSLTSMYYSLQVQTDTQRKDSVTDLLDDDYKFIFDMEPDSSDNFCASCAE